MYGANIRSLHADRRGAGCGHGRMPITRRRSLMDDTSVRRTDRRIIVTNAKPEPLPDTGIPISLV